MQAEVFHRTSLASAASAARPDFAEILAVSQQARVIEVSADRIEWLLTAILVVLLLWFLVWLVHTVRGSGKKPADTWPNAIKGRYSVSTESGKW